MHLSYSKQLSELVACGNYGCLCFLKGERRTLDFSDMQQMLCVACYNEYHLIISKNTMG